MLENIKPIYFIQRIFSYLDDNVKLRLIKYNKSLQNKIGIEYSYGELIFESEYINGKRNGKWYDDEGRIIYELKDGKGFIQDYVKINSKKDLIFQP